VALQAPRLESDLAAAGDQVIAVALTAFKDRFTKNWIFKWFPLDEKLV
jgi:hypothetical protein